MMHTNIFILFFQMRFKNGPPLSLVSGNNHLLAATVFQYFLKFWGVSVFYFLLLKGLEALPINDAAGLN
jgi:hypothetical protein